PPAPRLRLPGRAYGYLPARDPGVGIEWQPDRGADGGGVGARAGPAGPGDPPLRSGRAVRRARLRRTLTPAGHPREHGRARAATAERLRRAADADLEGRGGVPARLRRSRRG